MNIFQHIFLTFADGFPVSYGHFEVCKHKEHEKGKVYLGSAGGGDAYPVAYLLRSVLIGYSGVYAEKWNYSCHILL